MPYARFVNLSPRAISQRCLCFQTNSTTIQPSLLRSIYRVKTKKEMIRSDRRVESKIVKLQFSGYCQKQLSAVEREESVRRTRDLERVRNNRTVFNLETDRSNGPYYLRPSCPTPFPVATDAPVPRVSPSCEHREREEERKSEQERDRRRTRTQDTRPRVVVRQGSRIGTQMRAYV